MDFDPKKHFENMPKEEVDKCYNRTIVVMMVLEACFVLGVFYVLRMYANSFAADAWLMLAYLWCMKKANTNFARDMKPVIMKRLDVKDEDNDGCVEETERQDSKESQEEGLG